jgi:Protein of unknown function (DUF2855)
MIAYSCGMTDITIPLPNAAIDSSPQQLWVNKQQLAHTQLRALPQQALLAGQVRLTVDTFALTSNNITYAAFGDAMNYWSFFPTGQADWGIVPVWGFGTVQESLLDELKVGDVFYGYYPMASSVVLEPSKLSTRSFTDGAAHRADLHAIYNQYHRCSVDPFHILGQPATEAVLRPLFVTSWLIDDFLEDQGFFGAQTALLSSASSKTAYSAAYMLKQRGTLKVVGLTSAANVAFCEQLGCYDTVLSYEQLDRIAADTPCVYIDFAGNAALRMTIHTRFTALAYSCSVGGTHVTELGGAKGLPGPRATLFFAPAQSQKRIADWGGAEFGRRMVTAWHEFIQSITHAQPAWLTPVHHRGSDAVALAYQTVLAGKSDPRLGHMLTFK